MELQLIAAIECGIREMCSLVPTYYLNGCTVILFHIVQVINNTYYA